jgi:hypothetical protein
MCQWHLYREGRSMRRQVTSNLAGFVMHDKEHGLGALSPGFLRIPADLQKKEFSLSANHVERQPIRGGMIFVSNLRAVVATCGSDGFPPVTATRRTALLFIYLCERAPTNAIVAADATSSCRADWVHTQCQYSSDRQAVVYPRVCGIHGRRDCPPLSRSSNGFAATRFGNKRCCSERRVQAPGEKKCGTWPCVTYPGTES